jgi:hypothetical protein
MTDIITDNVDTPANFESNLSTINHLLHQVLNSSQYQSLKDNPDYEPDSTLEDSQSVVQHALAVHRIANRGLLVRL